MRVEQLPPVQRFVTCFALPPMSRRSMSLALFLLRLCVRAHVRARVCDTSRAQVDKACAAVASWASRREAWDDIRRGVERSQRSRGHLLRAQRVQRLPRDQA